MSPDDSSDKPSAPGSNPISAPGRGPLRSKRRLPAATLDYGAAMSRLDVLLLDADPERSVALRDGLKRRGRSVVVAASTAEAARVCEGMRPVVLLASLAGLSSEGLDELEGVVRSPGGDKIALLAFVCGDEGVAVPEGGPPVLNQATPAAIIDELARRWPEPAF